jgi:type I restriction enzyme S subunit
VIELLINEYTKLELMQKVKILETVNIINDTVKKFEGARGFLSTGDLDCTEIKALENVTYIDRPSRANQNVKKGDIILARMQGTVKVKIIDSVNEDIIVSTGFLVLRCNKAIYNRYLFHYLKSSLFQSKKDRLCSGATQKAINNNKLAEIKIPLADLSTQQKIVSILDKADELHKYNQQLIEKYDALTKSLFLEMFGVANSNRKDWPDVKIEDIVSKQKGSMRSGPFGSDLLHSEFVESGIPVLGIDNAVLNKFQWKQRRYITEEKYQKLKRYTVFPKDIIITIMGTIGRVAVVPDDIGIAINTKHLAAISLNHKIANPDFIAFSLHSDLGILSQINQKGKGAIMTGLNLTIIKELKLKLPPIELQNQFAERVQLIEAQKQQAHEAMVKSEALFQGLLQQAFKGKLN